MIHIKITDKPSYELERTSLTEMRSIHPNNDLFILLKDRHAELVGGVSGSIFGDSIYISKFWLNHPMRGNSCGSILLNELCVEAKKNGIKELYIGTHINYVKNILKNNDFNAMKSPSSCNHTDGCFIYTKMLEAFKAFPFDHDFSVIHQANRLDLTQFESKFFKDIKDDFHHCSLSTVYLSASNHTDLIAHMSGYIISGSLYVDSAFVNDHYFEPTMASTILDKLDEYAIDHQIRRVYLGTSDLDVKDFYLKNGYELIQNKNEVRLKGYSLRKSIQFAQ